MTQDLTASYAHALTDKRPRVSLYPELARAAKELFCICDHPMTSELA